MLKSWNKFNESKETVSIEMIQEIMYYCSGLETWKTESSEDIENMLNSSFYQIDQSFWDTFYEISYEEINKVIDKWFQISKSNPKLSESIINIYNKIREDNSNFPEIYQIEDECLDIIEMYNFSFYIDIKYNDKESYMIRMSSPWNGSIDMETFVKLMTVVKSTTRNLQSISTNCIVKLNSCEYHSEKWATFKIELTSKND